MQVLGRRHGITHAPKPLTDHALAPTQFTKHANTFPLTFARKTWVSGFFGRWSHWGSSGRRRPRCDAEVTLARCSIQSSACSIRSNLARFSPNMARLRPHIWAISAEFGLNQIGAGIRRPRPDLVRRIRPHLAWVRANLGDRGRTWSESGLESTMFGRVRQRLARIAPNVGRFRPTSSKVDRLWLSVGWIGPTYCQMCPASTDFVRFPRRVARIGPYFDALDRES